MLHIRLGVPLRGEEGAKIERLGSEAALEDLDAVIINNLRQLVKLTVCRGTNDGNLLKQLQTFSVSWEKGGLAHQFKEDAAEG